MKKVKCIVLGVLLFFVCNSVLAQKLIETRKTNLVSGDYTTQGTVYLESFNDGALHVRFDADYLTQSNVFDVHVFLTNNNNYTAPIDVSNALLVANIGTISGLNYSSGPATFILPEDIGINDYDYIVLVCMQFGQLHWSNGTFEPPIPTEEPIAEAGPDVTICAGQTTTLSASGGISYKWDNAETLDDPTSANPVATPSTTTTYTVTVTDANGCTDTDQVTITTDPACPIIVQLKALLEGPYNINTGLMNTILKSRDLLPLNHPYNVTPWSYSGADNVSSLVDIPNNAVDWVLVEMRDGADSTIVVSQRAAFLLEDGSVVDIDGSTSGVKFYNLIFNESYFITVRHRNHLDIVSKVPVTIPNLTPYDFTNVANVMGSGTPQVKSLGGGVYGMYAGDFDVDGIILVSDLNRYYSESAEVNEYVPGDCNLDRNVTVADFNLYQPNASVTGVVILRY